MKLQLDPLAKNGLSTVQATSVITGVSTSSSGGTSSPLTTKGDLYTYSTDNTRLPVGTNDYVLTADSTQATGLKWSPSSGGSMTYSEFEYNTDATPGGNVYNDFALLCAALNDQGGPKIISFTKDFGDTIPAGTYDLGDTILQSGTGIALYSPINIEDGAVFTNWTGKVQDFYMLTNCTTVSLVTEIQAFTLDVTRSVILPFGTLPMIQLGDVDGQAVFSLYSNDLSVLLYGGAGPVADGQFQLNVYGLGSVSIVNNDILTGVCSNAIFEVGTSSWNGGVIPTFSGLFLPNPISVNYYAAAGFTKYTNATSGLNAVDVQLAIDEVSARAQVTPPTASTDPGTPGWYAYDGTYFYICIATDTWLRTVALTW